jgi:glycosyltransferase involved in cell wall biosynthesis
VALARAPGRPRSYRLVYTVHGFHYLAKPPGAFHLGRAAEAFCMRQADCTNFVSDGDRGIAQVHGLLGKARSHRTIKNAVTVEPGLGNAPKRHDIGFLGRLTYQKNPLVLVDILQALRPLKPTLCVIGGGVLEAELAARVAAAGLAGQVTITGEQGRADALRLAATCRTLLLPSRWEGHPIALIEAMHLGLPVVASDVAGNNEIVIPGETGFLAPLDDAGAYAAHLARLLGDPGLARQFSANALQRVARDYSTSKMVGEHMAMYGLAPQSDTAGSPA